jgi:chromosome segregation ATPase
VNSKKSQGGSTSTLREPRPTRRDPRAEETTPSPLRSAAPSEESFARARGLRVDSDPPDLAAELAREREARNRDAVMLGEMFMRACDADAKRRTAELAADALAQRVATLESELREARAATGQANDRTLGAAAESRARELEQRVHGLETRLREAEHKTRHAEEKLRSAEMIGARLESAARASKDESASMATRIEMLEAELRNVRSDEQTTSERAASLSRKVEELSLAASHATELEVARAKVADLERQLAGAAEEKTRASMRASGLEAELARLVRKTTELDRERALARRGEEEAIKQVTTLRSEIEAARASGETQRVELERAIVERSAMDAALRTYADSASTVRAVLADLESEEARLAEARRRTFADAREMLGRAEKRTDDATELAAVRTPVVKVGAAKATSVEVPRPGRAEAPTPIATPRGAVIGRATVTGIAVPKSRAAIPTPNDPKKA